MISTCICLEWNFEQNFYALPNLAALSIMYLVMPRCGEGNGNSLQYSCLENPRDGGAW